MNDETIMRARIAELERLYDQSVERNERQQQRLCAELDRSADLHALIEQAFQKTRNTDLALLREQMRLKLTLAGLGITTALAVVLGLLLMLR